MDDAWLKAGIRDIPNFPKPGILFRDITPLLLDGARLRAAVDAFVRRYRPQQIKAVVAIEARGFLLGGALACALGVGLIPVRKQGKLPWEIAKVTYDLEYGTDTIEMHRDAVRAGDRVVVLDDVLATGGTSRATAQLVQQMQGHVVELAFLIELQALGGRSRLNGAPVFSLLQF